MQNCVLISLGIFPPGMELCFLNITFNPLMEGGCIRCSPHPSGPIETDRLQALVTWAHRTGGSEVPRSVLPSSHPSQVTLVATRINTWKLSPLCLQKRREGKLAVGCHLESPTGRCWVTSRWRMERRLEWQAHWQHLVQGSCSSRWKQILCLGANLSV